MVQYRVPILEQYAFQPPVKDKDLTTPPLTPVKGDRYIVAATASGAWLGHDNDIAWYDGTSWKFDTPSAGWMSYVEDEGSPYLFEGGVWKQREGDMLKSVYDTDNDGIVDKSENVDDGTGNATTAIQVKESYTRRAQYDAQLKALTFEI